MKTLYCLLFHTQKSSFKKNCCCYSDVMYGSKLSLLFSFLSLSLCSFLISTFLPLTFFLHFTQSHCRNRRPLRHRQSHSLLPRLNRQLCMICVGRFSPRAPVLARLPRLLRYHRHQTKRRSLNPRLSFSLPERVS